jgi:hypothetical protein
MRAGLGDAPSAALTPRERPIRPAKPSQGWRVEREVLSGQAEAGE